MTKETTLYIFSVIKADEGFERTVCPVIVNETEKDYHSLDGNSINTTCFSIIPKERIGRVISNTDIMPHYTRYQIILPELDIHKAVELLDAEAQRNLNELIAKTAEQREIIGAIHSSFRRDGVDKVQCSGETPAGIINACNETARVPEFSYHANPANDLVNRLAKTLSEIGVWEHIKGAITPGGDPAYRCPVCGKGEHCYGVEHPHKRDRCKDCGAKLEYPRG